MIEERILKIHGYIQKIAVELAGIEAEMHKPPETAVNHFCWPIGEKFSLAKWSGNGWFDANPYGNEYTNSSTGRVSYHTGADLNNNTPTWDSDRGSPVWAVADGTVTFAGHLNVWGNVIVIEHEGFFSRYGHVDKLRVKVGYKVEVGQHIASVGRDEREGPYHLHFDISLTDKLKTKPWDWPGSDLKRLHTDYTDPHLFLWQRIS